MQFYGKGQETISLSDLWETSHSMPEAHVGFILERSDTLVVWLEAIIPECDFEHSPNYTILID